jgi:hypothetical protein
MAIRAVAESIYKETSTPIYGSFSRFFTEQGRNRFRPMDGISECGEWRGIGLSVGRVSEWLGVHTLNR